MIEECFKENKTSARGRYMRNIADITSEWKDMRIADIIPDRSDICCIADIPELGEINQPKEIRYNAAI